MEKRKFYRLNYNIQAKDVRVIDEAGKQIGVFPLSDALNEAKKRGVDLVEIAPNAQPPVCKLINFKKFRYLEAKKTAEEKKKNKRAGLKEIRLTPFMAENDFRIKLNRAKDFLAAGNKVKFTIRFRGREMTKKDFGYQRLQKTIEESEKEAEVDIAPRFLGNTLEMVLRPQKGEKDEKKIKN